MRNLKLMHIVYVAPKNVSEVKLVSLLRSQRCIHLSVCRSKSLPPARDSSVALSNATSGTTGETIGYEATPKAMPGHLVIMSCCHRYEVQSCKRLSQLHRHKPRTVSPCKTTACTFCVTECRLYYGSKHCQRFES